tara:strand:- start:810 stop:1928 length:1119 start_codon:yes stop_codon:yes gene_type:complete
MSTDIKVTTGTNVKNARSILEHQIEMMWQWPERANEVPPLMFWGAPGIGKSTFIRDLCEDYGIGFIDVRLAQREPVDIRGLPVPRDDKQGIDWIISSEWPREGQEGVPEKGIILFDEITAADPTLQVAAYEFILDRRLGQLYEVPKGWYIVAAGNRTSDSAVSRTMSSALANRFCHIEIRADSKSWIDWAVSKRLDHRVTAFIRFAPHLLFNMDGNRERGWPSPRTWERVAIEMEMAEARKLEPVLVHSIIEGLVGPGAGIEFIGFLQWSEQIPDVGEMLRKNISIKIPERSDQKYAMASAIVHHIRQDQKPEELLDGLFEILLELSSDWAQLIHHDLTLALDADNLDDMLTAFFEHPSHAELENKILLFEV